VRLMNSIQGRLTVYIIAGTAMVLFVVGIIIDAQLSRQLEAEFNRSLLAKAMTMVTLTEQDHGVVEFDLVEDLAPEFKPGDRAEYLQLRFQDGTVLQKSSSLGNNALRHSGTELNQPRFEDLTLPDGRPGRLVVFKFIPIDDSGSEDEESEGPEQTRSGSGDDDNDSSEEPGGQGGDDDRESSDEPGSQGSDDDAESGVDGVEDESVAAADDPEDSRSLLIGDPSGGIGAADPRSDLLIDLALAQGKEPLAGLLATMRGTLLLSFILLMALLAGLARISINIGLKPLRQMAREVGSIGASNLDLRLTPASQSQELNPITDRLNDLLERLEDAFDREKRFSGNVAHELRTPIAELRTLAEVGKEWPSERDMVEGFFSDLIELADDMERTVVNLLMLARLDAGTQEVVHESFNLCDLVNDICKKFGQNSSERKISLDNRITEVLYVTTDKDKLKLILSNLIFNAVSYSPSDSSVVIEALREGEDVELIVSNETVDLCEHDVQMMFERFWRKDQVRSEDNHAGLGLSLVKALADLLKIRISPRLDTGSRLTLSLSGLEISV